MPDVLEPSTRPNGKPYRPRKIVACMVGEEDEGVLVLGTHDQERAQVLADQMAGYFVGKGFTAARPETGWHRDGLRGRRALLGERRGARPTRRVLPGNRGNGSRWAGG